MKKSLLTVLCALSVLANPVFAETVFPSSVSGGIRVFDGMVIHLQRPGITRDERRYFEEILRLFALGVYEATEGRHTIGTIKVRVVDETSEKEKTPSLIWRKGKGVAHAGLGGETIGSGGPITMYCTQEKGPNLFGGTTYANNVAAGILTHEWGHAAYGFGDEYANATLAEHFKGGYTAEVNPSVMHTPKWDAAGNLVWADLNFSIPAANPGTKFKSKKGTDQFNIWKGKSCWEVLVANDPDCFSDIRNSFSTFVPRQQVTSGMAAPAPFRVVWLDTPLCGICVDQSGSMATADRMANAIRTVKAKILNDIPDGTLVAVKGFDDDPNDIVRFTEIDDAKNKSTRRAVADKVGALQPAGGTAIWDALNDMIDAIVAKRATLAPDRDYPATIWFVTDGEDVSSRLTRAEVEARAAREGIKISAVGFGSGATHAEVRTVAEEPGGTFRSAGDSVVDLIDANARSETDAPGRVGLLDARKTVGTSGSTTASVRVDPDIKKLHVTVGLDGTGGTPNIRLVNPKTGKSVAPVLLEVRNGKGVAVFSVDRPDAGGWKVQVDRAGKGTKVTIQGKGTPTLDSARLRIVRRKSTLHVHVTKDAPVDGASVTATVINGTTRKTFALKAAGDGEYTLDLENCGNITGGLVIQATATAGKARVRFDSPKVCDNYSAAKKLGATFVRTAFLDYSQHVEATVTFDPRGGTVSPKKKSYKFHASYGYSFPIPVRKGYAFNGWHRKVTVGNSSWEEQLGTGSGSIGSSDIKVYAKWTKKKYNLNKTYYAEGGKLPLGYFGATPCNYRYRLTKDRETGVMPLTVGKPFGALPKPTRKGYTFTGWHCGYSSGRDGTWPGATKITSKTIVPDFWARLGLHAHWKAKTVKVSFDGNGGKASKKAMNFKYDSKYAKLPTAKRAGYRFGGWYTAKTGGTRVTAGSKVSLRKTLHAHWVKTTYLITLDANGGKVTNSAKKKVAKTKKKVKYGKAIGKLPAPKRKGYAFLGWYTAKKGGRKITASSTASGDRKLYARWTKGLTVHFVYNDGTGRKKTIVFPASLSNAKTLEITRKGYDLSGWYLVKNSTSSRDLLFTERNQSWISSVWDFNWPTKKVKRTGKWGDGSTYTYYERVKASPVTVYATWDVRVEFNPMGGTVSPTWNAFARGTAYWNSGKWCTGFPTPEKDGSTFEGWYTDPYSGTRLTGWEKASKPMTLYAHWSANAKQSSKSARSSAGVVKAESSEKHVFFVAGNGSDESSGLTRDEPLATIQRALDLAKDGDEVYVAPGEYAPFASDGKAVEIISEEGPAETVVDASLLWPLGITNRCATLGEDPSSTNTVLSGFSLVNGNAERGGGSFAGTLEDCILKDNVAAIGGAAYGGVLIDCILQGNMGRIGGAAYGGILVDCFLLDNVSTEGEVTELSVLENCDIEEVDSGGQ